MQDFQTQSQPSMLSRLFGLILARLLSPLASFLLIILIARLWGETQLGQYMTVLAWLAIFQILSVFGLGEYTAREVGKDPSRAEKFMNHSLTIGIIFSILCLTMMSGGAVLLKYPQEVRSAIITASLALPAAVCVIICHAVFTAFQRIRFIALASVVENLFLLLAGSIIIFNEFGIIPLVWCIVTTRWVTAIFNLFLIHAYVVSIRYRIDWTFLWKLLTPAAVFGLTAVASTIYLRIDVIMLSKMTDMVIVGLYSSAGKLMEISLMLPLAFYVLNLPVAARLYKSFPASVQQKIEGYTKELFILVFFVFGMTTFFAEFILSSFYGSSFTSAAWVLRLLMFAFLIQSAEVVLAMSSQAAGYHKVALYIVAFRAVLNVLLNLILIPIWGMLGAALATLLSVVFSFAAFQIFVSQTLHGFQWISLVKKPAVTCLVIITVLFTLIGHLSTIYLFMIFLLSYGLSSLALNRFSFFRSPPNGLG